MTAFKKGEIQQCDRNKLQDMYLSNIFLRGVIASREISDDGPGKHQRDRLHSKLFDSHRRCECYLRTCDARRYLQPCVTQAQLYEHRIRQMQLRGWLQLRYMTSIRRPFDCLSMITNVKVTKPASRIHADLFIYRHRPRHFSVFSLALHCDL